MNVTIIGGTGRLGKALVKKASAANLKLHLLVRNEEKATELQKIYPELSYEVGDITQSEDIKRATKSAQVLVVALSPDKSQLKNSLFKRSVEAILNAGPELEKKQLIWVSGAGVVDERDAFALSRVFIRGIMKVLAGAMLKDSEEAIELIRASRLNWTIPRAPILGEQEGNGKYQASYTPPKPKPLSRDDFAEFIVEVIRDESGKWKGEAPMLGVK